MHPNDERIQRLLNGELSPAEESSVRAHLRECGECRDRAATMERDEAEVHALLRAVDHPMVRIDAQAVAERARTPERDTREGLRRAALILLGIGLVGVAYAVPGSPLRAWVHSAAERFGFERLRDDEPEAADSIRIDAGAPDQGSGVAVEPGQSFVIDFLLPKSGNRASVSVTSGPAVVVSSFSGAATYSTGADRIDIEIRDGDAEFRVEIPESARRVEIRAGGIRLFLKDGEHVSTSAPKGPSSYIIPLTLPLTPRDSER